jgi:UDP-N-acetyl-2-amino-2-deoxyglucuronate dehydrogenase
MKVSVVGCGGISKCHLNALSEMDDIEISSVVDIKLDRADAAAEKYNCKAYYDFDTMLKEDKPDSIHICTPHYLHVPMAIEALSRDINVLCEKPCAINYEDLSKLRLAQSMCSVQFGVCFQNRYNSSVKLVKDLIDKKTYGNITAARASVNWCRNEDYYSDDWHGTLEKEGGGVLVNQSIHTLDLMRYLVGKNVKAVTGHVYNDHLKGKIEVEDTANVRFVYDDGMIALFNATTAFSMNADIIIDLFCEKATLRIEGDNAYVINSDGIEQLHLAESSSFVGKNYWGRSHGLLIKDFYDCIKNDRKFPIDAYEGGKAVDEFLTIYKSSKSGNEEILNRK